VDRPTVLRGEENRLSHKHVIQEHHATRAVGVIQSSSLQGAGDGAGRSDGRATRRDRRVAPLRPWGRTAVRRIDLCAQTSFVIYANYVYETLLVNMIRLRR
jgi:hypothetical protein